MSLMSEIERARESPAGPHIATFAQTVAFLAFFALLLGAVFALLLLRGVWLLGFDRQRRVYRQPRVSRNPLLLWAWLIWVSVWEWFCCFWPD